MTNLTYTLEVFTTKNSDGRNEVQIEYLYRFLQRFHGSVWKKKHRIVEEAWALMNLEEAVHELGGGLINDGVDELEGL